MAKKKSTGLGANAFFQTPKNQPVQPPSDESVPSPPAETPPARQYSPSQTPPQTPPKPKKVRTTVLLYPETMALLESLKIDLKRRGKKATFSDVLAEAIHDLAQKWNIQT